MVSYVASAVVVASQYGNVLILIVVEDGLVHVTFGAGNHVMIVLILIVVEDGLVPNNVVTTTVRNISLNPYCSGRWSRTDSSQFFDFGTRVLIVIVVEDGLVL